jgi:hypothetical protein
MPHNRSTLSRQHVGLHVSRGGEAKAVFFLRLSTHTVEVDQEGQSYTSLCFFK